MCNTFDVFQCFQRPEVKLQSNNKLPSESHYNRSVIGSKCLSKRFSKMRMLLIFMKYNLYFIRDMKTNFLFYMVPHSAFECIRFLYLMCSISRKCFDFSFKCLMPDHPTGPDQKAKTTTITVQ